MTQAPDTSATSVPQPAGGTDVEKTFLDELIQRGVVVFLASGVRLEGVLMAHGANSIQLSHPNHPRGQLISWTAISTIHQA